MSRFFVLFLLTLTLLFSKNIEEFPFIGVTVGIHTIDIVPITPTNPISPAVDVSSSEDETTVGIRYGKQTLDWRTMFTLSGNKDYQSFSLEIDKILMDDLFGMPELRPYLGATVGYLHYDNDAFLNDDGIYYGGNFGFLVYVTDSIDADISYHYYKLQDMEPLDTLQGGTLGIHYFY